MSKEHISLVVCGHVDAGKCFQKGTKIKMYNGLAKNIEDINVGETVMGIDSNPRHVLSTTSGKSEMFNIIPTSYGGIYTVNDEHILTLKASACKNLIYDESRDRYHVRWLTKEGLKEESFSKSKYDVNYKEEAEKFLNKIENSEEYIKKGDIIDIKLKSYMDLNKSSQDMFKGFSVGVEYENKNIDIDPYLYGLWLGDGTSKASSITSADQEIVDYLNNWATENRLKINKVSNYRYDITTGTNEGGARRNNFTNFLKDNNLWGNKHIIDKYKYNNRLTRMNLLAGLIDSDGSMTHNCYDIIFKNEKLAYDTVELSRSLGFRTTINKCEKTCVISSNNRVTGVYHRIFISGEGLEQIPVLLERKKCHIRESKKDACVSGIKIESIGQDEYFGFELDNDGRFLLDDFTVTHNSTTTGHLIFKLGGIDKREMEKLQAEADQQGKSSFAFAYYMDKSKVEREKGVTIECATKEFFTDTYHYTIVDAPGHRDYVKNMITGAGCADVALLLVPAEMGGFETAIAKGDHSTGEVQGQTRQHARLLGLLGIEKLIVGVNKMDSCDWSEQRFNEIKEEMTKMITLAGFKPKQVAFVPYSGFQGENLVEQTDKMPWYKGWSVNLSKTETVSGFTLYDALEKVARPPKRFPEKALRIPINGIYKIKGVGDVITGRIEQGTLNAGETVSICPRGLENLKVFSIEMHHKTWPNAKPGDNVGMNIKGFEKGKMPKVGDVIYVPKEGEIRAVESFVAQVVVQEHPGQLKPGFSPCVHVRTAKSACKMTNIIWKIGKKTGNEKQDNPQFLERGESAEVEFKPQQSIFIESFDDCQGLGRVAVMDSNQLVMLGKVMSVKYKDVKKK